MAISKIQYKASSSATPVVWMDATTATAVAADITSPKTAMLADGVVTTGTGTGGGGAGGSVTQDENGYLVVSPYGSGNGGEVTQDINGNIHLSNQTNATAVQKQVNFIDYDGSIRYSYTAQEANALTALPANPVHEKLTAQGWNWTLAQIKAQLTAMPNDDVWVGQMYTTKSGATEIDIDMHDPTLLSPYLVIGLYGTVSIDWGDGSTADTMTDTAASSERYKGHTYANTGKYTIKISVVSGYFTFYSSSANYGGVLRSANSATNRERSTVYSGKVKAVRIGDNARLSSRSFSNCTHMETVTIPNTVTSLGIYSFYFCRSLKSITIPNTIETIPSQGCAYNSSMTNLSISYGVTTMDNNAFGSNTVLRSVTIPISVTSLGNQVFIGNLLLRRITIPSGITSIGPYFVNQCYDLQNITIPNGVTSIGNNAFTNCWSLRSLTIPDSVTTIGDTVFNNMYGAHEFHFQRTTPPTIGATPFEGIVSGTVIYVPYSADHSVLNAYKTATNWATYASYIQEEAAP